MVDKADLPQANMLASEVSSIDRALANFAAGGDIIAMTISSVPTEELLQEEHSGPPPWGRGQTISTLHMTHPPSMLETIKTQLQQRRTALMKELTDMGVTGGK